MKTTKLNFKKSFTVLVAFLGMLTTTPSWAYNGLLTGEGSTTSPYYIMDLDDWATFTSWLNTPETAPYYCDKHYRLGNDIGNVSGFNPEVVTTWAASLKDYPFRGTFDGQGHTIYINFTKSPDDIVSGDETSQGVALFQYVGGGCVIHDLIVEGNIESNYEMAGGIISYIVKGSSGHLNAVNVSRCTSHVHFVLGKTGDAMSGGLVAFSEEYVHLTVNDCLFSGSYYGTNCTHLSGIVGFQASNGFTYIDNCYVNPGSLTIPHNDNNRNLCRYSNKDCFKESNCYYSATASGFTDDQGDYVSSSHSAEWVANQLGYWTVANDRAIPMTLDMVAPNCTLFKGFTVSSYYIPSNDNDNNGDQGVAKLVDSDRASTWCVSYPYYGHYIWEPIHVEFYSDKKIIPKGYILTTGKDSREYPDRRPKKWQIRGYQNTYDSDMLDTRDASGSREKLPETEITDKVYFFTDYENINTEYQKFMFEVVELWREDRVWDGIFHGGWNVNEADFVCELGEIQIFGVLSDDEVHNLENCAISGIQSCYEYTGDVIPFNYLVTDYYNTLLVEGTDYTKTMVRKHGNNSANVEEVNEEGEYTITFTGIGDYDGTKSYSFVVTDPDIPMPLVWTNDNGMTYYYVKMPKTGQTTLDLTSTDPEFTDQFHVFSDNGHDLPYSTNCNGKLLITAPAEYALQVQGTISCKGYPDDYLVMYDGYDDTYDVLGDGHYGAYGTQDIPLLYTTGRYLLLDFKSNGIQSDFTGVNLTVTLVSPIDYHDITIAEDNHGALTPTGEITEVIFGTPVTLNVVPDEGYMLQDVSVKTSNGTEVMSDKGLWYTGKNTVTFNMPASNVEVTPTFAAKNELSMNMPANSSDLAHATNAIIPAEVTIFKIYDDGGPNGNYSKYCNGMLLLTAPDSTVLEISGEMNVYDYDDSYLGIYNGDDFSDPIECFYDDTDFNRVLRVLSTGNQVLLVFVTYGSQASGLDLTVRVIDKNKGFDIDIIDVTGGTVTVHGGATKAHVYDTLTLDVTTNPGYLITEYAVSPDCNRAVSGGIWHENPTEATFVMPADDIEITPIITNTLTADGGLYINMPTSNKYDYKVVDIPSGVTSFKVFDDGGSMGDYSMYCDGYLLLKAPLDYRLKLSGTVRCNNEGTLHDYLKVYDGDTVTAMPLGKPNGYGNTSGETINSLVSSQNSMLLNFHASNNSMSGLDLTVEVTNEESSYSITFDNSQAPEGCGISISGYESVSNNQYVAHVGNPITVSVSNDDNHLLNAISLKDAEGNEIPLSAGMCWYNGNNSTATFTMLPRNLFITYEFVNKGDQYVKLPKQNGIGTMFEVTPIEGITSFKIYDDGGPNGNYSNNCDSYMLLTAPEGEAWLLTGTVKTEHGSDYMIPYDGNTMTSMIDDCSYGKPSGEDIGTLVTINHQMLIVFGSNSAVNNEGLDLTATIINPIKRVVDGYAGVSAGRDKWTFIAAPLKNGKAPTYVENLFPVGEYGEPLVTSAEYDLYRFNQSADAEWENYKVHSNNFSIDGGNGYLYATKYVRTMCFGGSVYTGDSKEVSLNYDANAGTPGWNLVGNPLMAPAYPNRPYYTINELGNEIEPVDDYSSQPIPICTGIMVKAEGEGESITFSKTRQQQSSSRGGLHVILTAHEATRDGSGSMTLLDKAIVSFNEGAKLGKFYFGTQDANIYIPQDGKEYAIVGAEAHGEMPVCFKARKNGSYTISVNPDNVELNYLHLIDNIAGEDIDLLAMSSYTFTAKTTDYASRFKLVFYANENDSENFAFICNGEIIVNGEGTVLVIDLLGHILITHQANIHSLSTDGLTPGTYILRLINSENVKTQKIIIK